MCLLLMAVGRVEAGRQCRWWSWDAWRGSCSGGSLVFSLHCSLGEPSLLPRRPVLRQVGEEVFEVVSQQLSALFILPSISLLSTQVNLWRLTTRWSSTSGMRRRPSHDLGHINSYSTIWTRFLRTTTVKSLCTK